MATSRAAKAPKDSLQGLLASLSRAEVLSVLKMIKSAIAGEGETASDQAAARMKWRKVA